MNAVAKLEPGSSRPPEISVDGSEPVAGAKKVRFQAKLAAFVLATLALSWFFQGWREVNTVGNLQSWATLVLGTLSTLLVLCVWAYWIYMEEKSKGTLKKRIVLFESISQYLDQRSCCSKKSDGNNGE